MSVVREAYLTVQLKGMICFTQSSHCFELSVNRF